MKPKFPEHISMTQLLRGLILVDLLRSIAKLLRGLTF